MATSSSSACCRPQSRPYNCRAEVGSAGVHPLWKKSINHRQYLVFVGERVTVDVESYRIDPVDYIAVMNSWAPRLFRSLLPPRTFHLVDFSHSVRFEQFTLPQGRLGFRHLLSLFNSRETSETLDVGFPRSSRVRGSKAVHYDSHPNEVISISRP